MSGKPTRRSRSGLVYRLPENQRIKIIGLGGIGSIVLQFLSLFLDSRAGWFSLTVTSSTLRMLREQLLGSLGTKRK